MNGIPVHVENGIADHLYKNSKDFKAAKVMLIVRSPALADADSTTRFVGDSGESYSATCGFMSPKCHRTDSPLFVIVSLSEPLERTSLAPTCKT